MLIRSTPFLQPFRTDSLFVMSTLSTLALQALSLAGKGITLVFPCLPIWICLSLRNGSRPRQPWTIARTIAVKAFQWTAILKKSVIPACKSSILIVIFHSVDVLQEPSWRTLQPNANGVWIPPVPHLIVGEVKKWADLAEVTSVRIPGYWIDRPGSTLSVDARPIPGQKVLYALHGGCYALYSAHPSSAPSNIPRGILEHSGSSIWRSFVLEYRLTSGSSEDPRHAPNPFPAALLDAIAGYNYLVNDVGMAPEDIIVEGDSAGGNLALALTRYLLENHERTDVALPAPPSALILCNPWVDLGPPPTEKSSSVHTNVSSDILDISARHFRDLCTNFCGALGDAAAYTNRYISPASLSPAMQPVSFENFPRTFILCGGAEVLRDQIHVLRQKMEIDMSSALVKCVEFPDAFHAFLWFPYFSEPERTEAFHVIADWVSEKC